MAAGFLQAQKWELPDSFNTWTSKTQKVISVIPMAKVVPEPAHIQGEEEETLPLLCGKVTWPGAFVSEGNVIVCFGNLISHSDAHHKYSWAAHTTGSP